MGVSGRVWALPLPALGPGMSGQGLVLTRSPAPALALPEEVAGQEWAGPGQWVVLGSLGVTRHRGVCEVRQQDAGRHLEAGAGPRSPLTVGCGRRSLVEGCVGDCMMGWFLSAWSCL